MRQDDQWKSASTAGDCTGRDVHVWKMSLLKTDAGFSCDSLSADEMKRAERFRFDSDRNKFVRTRTTLRGLLSRYTGVAAKELTFSYNEYGKPYLRTPGKNKALFFNVSHSRDIALFAFSRNCELGIDIEYMRDDVQCLKLGQRFFAEQEYQALAKLSGNALIRGFYRCWTRKEAFVKAVGAGLSFPLDSFAVTFEEDDRPQLIWTDKARFRGTCTLFPVLHDEKYLAALACLGDPAQVDFYHCS
ncbi:MAG: 4'-phosphopantetheinyl transferase superfamily protein [Proteobacteria bacterium]|nr:4'-phosphopantetheinyl transferase superfamily protein [Pseudomonadota bacterium]MBU1059008.1 4'-phosphopantetheinyl transferase superfamily protein [Pseudomonadota bacterium]